MSNNIPVLDIECKGCHQIQHVPTNHRHKYTQLVLDNYLCLLCTPKFKRQKVEIPCTVCKVTYMVHILPANLLNYKDFVCPNCVEPEIKKKDRLKNPKDYNCNGCKANGGVCFHPEYSCTKSTGFAAFDTCGIYDDRYLCTIMSVNEIDPKRDDFHTFKYVLLYKDKYLVATKNIIIFKQRVGSKINFKNRIHLFTFNGEKFERTFEKDFDKGDGWIVEVKNHIIGKKLL